jgi:hypothetical protein
METVAKGPPKAIIPKCQYMCLASVNQVENGANDVNVLIPVELSKTIMGGDLFFCHGDMMLVVIMMREKYYWHFAC